MKALIAVLAVAAFAAPALADDGGRHGGRGRENAYHEGQRGGAYRQQGRPEYGTRGGERGHQNYRGRSGYRGVYAYGYYPSYGLGYYNVPAYAYDYGYGYPPYDSYGYDYPGNLSLGFSFGY